MCSAAPQAVAFDLLEASVARKAKPLAPKRAARRKGLVDQLSHPVIVLEDAQALQEWGVGAYEQFKPRNAWQDWLTQQAALTTFRINRIQRIERRLRDWSSLRAIDFWDEDQALAVETLALRIDREPLKVVVEMLMTPAGCDWLIGRWRALATVGPENWTTEQKTLAQHLVRGEPTSFSVASIAARITALEHQRARALETDAIARTLVEADLSDKVSPSLAQLRRYERTLIARLKWFVAEARFEAPDRSDQPRFRPEYTAPRIEPFGESPSGDVRSQKDETNPTSASALDLLEPEIAKTNPIEPDPEAEIAKTNPIEPAREPLEQLAEVVFGKEVKVEKLASVADRVEERKRRIDPMRAVAQARKARRQSA